MANIYDKDGNIIDVGGSVTIQRQLMSGVPIAKINGTQLYAPDGGGGGNLPPLTGKTLVVFGDSAVAAGTWASRMAATLGANYQQFAMGGATWRNKWTDEQKTTFDNKTLGKRIELFEAWVNQGNIPDIIQFQIGGNDIIDGDIVENTDVDGNACSNYGSVQTAFKYLQYEKYQYCTTTAECMRYYLELLRRQFPNALIVVGTIFQRYSTDPELITSKAISDIIRDVCYRLGIQVIEGDKYIGFSQHTEAFYPRYTKDNGVTVLGGTPTKENPYFCFMRDSDHAVVNVSEAEDSSGNVKTGYSVRYGLYTYDGKHVNDAGDDKVYNFMCAALKSLV